MAKVKKVVDGVETEVEEVIEASKPWENGETDSSTQETAEEQHDDTVVEVFKPIVTTAKVDLDVDVKAPEAKIGDDELVVALVKSRYHLPLADGTFKVYEEGDQIMPRSHADHWFSKTRGTKIIGVPDVNSFKSADVQRKFKAIKADLDDFIQQFNTLQVVTDFTDIQKEHLGDIGDFITSAKNALDAFIKTVGGID
jgi:hypothetical protein